MIRRATQSVLELQRDLMKLLGEQPLTVATAQEKAAALCGAADTLAQCASGSEDGR